MLKFFRRKEDPLDIEIAAVLSEMAKAGVNNDEYPKLMVYLEQLYEMRTRKRPPSVSGDTIALVLGNFALGLLVVAYEQKHVITSKVIPPFIRPKVN